MKKAAFPWGGRLFVGQAKRHTTASISTTTLWAST
jgi:hypothetical protein